MLAVRKNLMKEFDVSVDENALDRVIYHSTVDIGQRYLAITYIHIGGYLPPGRERLRRANAGIVFLFSSLMVEVDTSYNLLRLIG